jgi:RNA recognition motif-containing protein
MLVWYGRTCGEPTRYMKLFVGNLSYDVSEDELREAFAEFEPLVEFYRPHDRETGKPRGFAFVTLADREKGEAAIAALNDKRLGGRELKVNEAEDRRNRAPARSNHSGDDETTLGNLPRVDDRPMGKDGNKVRYKSI